MSGITPARYIATGWKWAGAALLTAALVTGIILGGWQLGWWLHAHNVNRQAHVIQNGYANQSALQQQVAQGIANVDTITVQMDGSAGQQLADLHAQRLAVAGTVCDNAARISAAVPLPATEQQWVSRNCSDGVLSLSSPLRKEDPH